MASVSVYAQTCVNLRRNLAIYAHIIYQRVSLTQNYFTKTISIFNLHIKQFFICFNFKTKMADFLLLFVTVHARDQRSRVHEFARSRMRTARYFGIVFIYRSVVFSRRCNFRTNDSVKLFYISQYSHNYAMSRQNTLSNYFTSASTSSTEASGSTVDSSGSVSQSNEYKKKTVRKTTNLAKWQNEFRWLQYEKTDGLMYCSICKESKRVNAFVQGSNNFQRSGLLRHSLSNDHRIARKANQEKKTMIKITQEVKDAHLPVLSAQLKTCIFMAKNNISDRLFTSLLDLQVTFVIYLLLFYYSTLQATVPISSTVI